MFIIYLFINYVIFAVIKYQFNTKYPNNIITLYYINT